MIYAVLPYLTPNCVFNFREQDYILIYDYDSLSTRWEVFDIDKWDYIGNIALTVSGYYLPHMNCNVLIPGFKDRVSIFQSGGRIQINGVLVNNKLPFYGTLQIAYMLRVSKLNIFRLFCPANVESYATTVLDDSGNVLCFWFEDYPSTVFGDTNLMMKLKVCMKEYIRP